MIYHKDRIISPVSQSPKTVGMNFTRWIFGILKNLTSSEQYHIFELFCLFFGANRNFI